MKLSSKLAVVAGGGLAGWALVRTTRNRMYRDSPLHALTETLPTGVDNVGPALYQSTGFEMTEGNRITFCNNEEIFEALREAFRSAKESIHVDVFIWKEKQPGESLADEVVAAARRGVAVRVMVDPLGSEGFERELCERLRREGCKVHYFRPPRLKPFQLLGRNHRKLVVIDGRVGFTGGFGIGPEWLGEDGPTWRDSNVRVEGPVVRQMQQSFAAHWLEVGGGLLPASELEKTRPAGKARACFITSTDVKGHSNARWVTAITIAAAQRQLWIANAYFVPPPTLVDSLAVQARGNVDVRLLLPGEKTDHRWIFALQKARYPALIESGVRVFEYQPSMMHAKTALVDDRLVVVGSINLDILSQEILEEGALVVDDEDAAGTLKEWWRRDLGVAKEVGVTYREQIRPALQALTQPESPTYSTPA